MFGARRSPMAPPEVPEEPERGGLALIHADEFVGDFSGVVESSDEVDAKADAELANLAAEKLGYQPLGEEVKKQTDAFDLLALMREHQIAFYRPADVDQYKREMVFRGRQTHMRRRWHTYLLEKYEQPIPRGALEKALSVKEVAPSVGFEVESLEEYSVPFDPLLFVVLDAARLCIAKWDEPKFTAPMTS